MDSNIIENFKTKSISIIGDIMLDTYIYGSSNRMSPEFPKAPVIKIEKECSNLGGCGNVYKNLSNLGCNANLITVIGDDSVGIQVLEMIDNCHVDDYILVSKRKRTTEKIRIVNGNSHIARLDKEDDSNLMYGEENEIIEKIKNLYSKDAILIQDYAKGIITENICNTIRDFNYRKFVSLDPHPKNKNYYKDLVHLMTPNKKEALELIGIKYDRTNLTLCNNEILKDVGKELYKEYNIPYIAITLSENGMFLFEDGKFIKHIEATKRKAINVSGCGDTVISVMTLAMVSGFDFIKSANLANISAGVVVKKSGTDPIEYSELINELERYKHVFEK